MPGSSIHKSVIEVPWTPMDNDGTCAKFTSFSIQKVAHPSGTNLQHAAETCEFVQISLF